jgi:hypothetical protein
MNYAVPRCRVYDPDAISTMGRAFEKAVKNLSQQAKADSNIRRNIARCIIRLFDEGERAPSHLCIIALSIVVGHGPKPASKQPHSSVLSNWCPIPLGH